MASRLHDWFIREYRTKRQPSTETDEVDGETIRDVAETQETIFRALPKAKEKPWLLHNEQLWEILWTCLVLLFYLLFSFWLVPPHACRCRPKLHSSSTFRRALRLPADGGGPGTVPGP